MKKNFVWSAALAASFAAIAMTASANGFTKTNTYTDGMFTDVPNGEWYASSVSSAYELGFMKGSSATAFEPDGNMTVAEAITIAARVNDAYSAKGTAFDQSGANWYDCYVNYAVSNGIITADQFDSYERNITRAEMAVVFSKSVPADFLTAKNDVKKIPDVPNTNAYFNDVLSLYNAGVIMGNDEFGTFKPNNNITRAEAAAIINRVALPESRLAKALVDADYGDAYYLVDQGTANSLSSTKSVYDSPWQYDNRNRLAVVSNMADHIADFYPDGKVELWRDIENNTEGLLSWEFTGSFANAGDGAYFMLTDDDKNASVSLTTAGGKFVINGKATDVAVPSGTGFFIIDTDLDTRKGTLYINGKKVTDFDLGNYPISRVYIGSTEEGTAQINISKCDIYKNYLANDRFVAPTDSELARWEVSGEASIVQKNGQGYVDSRSAELKTGAVAKKTFNKVSGSIVFQALMLLPEDADAGYISLNSGDVSAAKISVNADGVYNGSGEKLRHHAKNIWQTLRIEADTTTGLVTYKVNGKKVGEGSFDTYCQTIDNITVGNTGGVIWFDDVQVYMTHEYDDYCPTPKPVTDDGYDVILNMCSLWHEGQHFGWGAVSGYPDIEPALGYYDEGLVEVADWEIKFMVENGIDVQHLCWYAPASNIVNPIKKSSMNDALHEGFFNAKYSDLMKFTFMWENTGVNCSTLEQFEEYIWDYWMDYYFLDDRFYTIDNNIVFTVWSYGNFKKAFGGTNEGAIEAVEWMNKDAKANGFDGVMIFFADGHAQDANSFANMAAAGGTAAYAYHWNQDGNNADKTIARLQRNQDHGKIHVVPTVSVGFNNVGWSYERKNLAPLADHKKVLEYIKNNYLTKETGWKAKTLIVSTWNEYGEGTYVMPCEGLHGFGYLENVAEVISGITDHSTNVYPTEQQKARLGHLYPDSKTSLKHWGYETETTDLDIANVALVTYGADDFEKAQNINSMEVVDGVLAVDAGNDGALKPVGEVNVNADKILAIRVTMQSDFDSNMEIFFTTEASPSLEQSKSYRFPVKKSSGFESYTFLTSSNAAWDGTVKGFRFDPTFAPATYKIKSIELLGEDEALRPVRIFADRKEYEAPFYPTLENGEIYTVADAYNGFFSLHNLYYEWSRKTGKLYILTQNDREIVFNVGSDVAIVDGKETKLAKKIELRDGLPVLPLFFIYDIAETNYKFENNTVTVSSAGGKYQEIVDNRVAYSYEFEVPGDMEGFTPSFMTAVVVDGVMKGSSTERADQKPAYDPMLTLANIKLNTLSCNKLIISMKHDFPESVTSSVVEVFFETDKYSGLSQDKSARATITSNSSNGKFIEYTVDFSENEKWSGNVTKIRLDPFTNAGDYEIDYIRFVMDESIAKENEAKLQAEQQAALDRAEKGIVVVNGDAEDADNPTAFYGEAKNAKVEIYKDAEKGNVWKVTPDSDGKVWSYMRQKVAYVPGVTYKVTADIKAVNEDENGFVCCNAVYKDGDKVDHVVWQNNTINGTDWKHFEFTFTVPITSTDRSQDKFCFYSNPNGDKGFAFLIDNITVQKA